METLQEKYVSDFVGNSYFQPMTYEECQELTEIAKGTLAYHVAGIKDCLYEIAKEIGLIAMLDRLFN